MYPFLQLLFIKSVYKNLPMRSSRILWHQMFRFWDSAGDSTSLRHVCQRQIIAYFIIRPLKISGAKMTSRSSKRYLLILLILSLTGAVQMAYAKNIYDFEPQLIDATVQKLSDYEGKVLLIVNTASKCGFTKQYEGLQKLYDDYKEQGFAVLGFPANNFMNQEPGENDTIAQFCRLNFGVSFPLFAKLSVRGKNIHPLFDWLTSKTENPEYAGKVTWNFNKFLISKDGRLIGRFGSRVEPSDPELIKAIKEALAS